MNQKFTKYLTPISGFCRLFLVIFWIVKNKTFFNESSDGKTGLAYGVFLKTILMMIPLVLIRSKAGGYHVKTHLGCIVGFNISYQLVLFMIKAINMGFAKHIAALL